MWNTPPLPPAVLLLNIDLSIITSLSSTCSTPASPAAELWLNLLSKTEIEAFPMQIIVTPPPLFPATCPTALL